MIVKVSGITVEIIKKNIKNMHLSVLPPDGKVRVSVPISLSNENVKMFVRTKIGWIKRQQESFKSQPRQSIREYVSGETLYLWGKQYFLEVLYSNKSYNVDLKGNKAIFTVRTGSTPKQRERYIYEWYRSLLKDKVDKYMTKWEQKTGFYCDSWQVKYMKTRWGSCNTERKRILINLQLAKKPIECLEYIILHELAHLKVKNHGEKFIEILDEFMPYWRESKKLLNDSKLDYMPLKE